MADMGNIERVDLREVWPDEAEDFTPWLAQNLDRLGDALGLDLELRTAEAAVGSFSLDILAYDRGGDRPVIIENQLDTTNNDHLGKLLTYAAGYDAYAVVWVTREFRDEHRQTLDWLNQRSDEDTQFFGVVVEAWRIDQSRPAPHFRAVAMPNDWYKLIGGVSHSEGRRNIRGRRSRYLAYWPTLGIALERHGFSGNWANRTQNWMVCSSDFPGATWNFSFQGSRKSFFVELYIATGNPDTNDKWFNYLLERRGSIESDLADSLHWDRHLRENYRISSERPGTIDDNPEELDGLRAWMVDRALAFKRVFTPHLQELAE